MLKLGALVVTAALAANTPILSPMPPQQSPNIQTVEPQQKPKDGVSGQQQASDAVIGLKQGAGNNKNDNGNGDAPEITVVGIKLGELLLGLFTLGLWWSTQSLVRESKATSKRQLRAYLGIKNLSFEFRNTHRNVVEINGIFQHFMVAEIQNFGSTLAKEVRFVGYISRTGFGVPLPDEFNFDGPNDASTVAQTDSFTSTFILFPGQSEISKVSIQELAALQYFTEAKARQASLYFWGRIYYRDIYGRPWRTKFCHVWEPWHPGGERFVPYERHNEEDQKAFSDLA